MVKRTPHSAWKDLLPRLREMLDREGLQHIAIDNDNGGLYLSSERLSEQFVMSDGPGICFSFRPNDPDWRIYELEGEPFEKWEIRARMSDLYGAPVISLSAEGKWEIRFGYEQGLLPAEVFDDEQTFLATLMDSLVKHYSSRVYTLRVWTNTGKGRENGFGS